VSIIAATWSANSKDAFSSQTSHLLIRESKLLVNLSPTPNIFTGAVISEAWFFRLDWMSAVVLHECLLIAKMSLTASSLSFI
jgi:hypothetical protein